VIGNEVIRRSDGSAAAIAVPQEVIDAISANR
jgi:hypothetical protein